MNHDANHDSHPDIGCLAAIEGLYSLLDGEIEDPAETADIEAHIAHCTSCYSRAELERLITERIRVLHESGKSEIPGRLRERLRLIIDDLE